MAEKLYTRYILERDLSKTCLKSTSSANTVEPSDLSAKTSKASTYRGGEGKTLVTFDHGLFRELERNSDWKNVYFKSLEYTAV